LKYISATNNFQVRSCPRIFPHYAKEIQGRGLQTFHRKCQNSIFLEWGQEKKFISRSRFETTNSHQIATFLGGKAQLCKGAFTHHTLPLKTLSWGSRGAAPSQPSQPCWHWDCIYTGKSDNIWVRISRSVPAQGANIPTVLECIVAWSIPRSPLSKWWYISCMGLSFLNFWRRWHKQSFFISRHPSTRAAIHS